MFVDRRAAGRQLASRLLPYKDAMPCILALPRGGVPVGFEIAKALNAPLDLVLVRKIGAPFEPELALGAVADGDHPEAVFNDPHAAGGGLESYVAEQLAKELKEIERRRQAYVGTRARLDVSGRTAIVVDDGIATGATIRAALRIVRRGHPKRLILAVPVAPTETLAALRSEVDDVVCLEARENSWGIGAYYADFSQVADDVVRDLVARSPAVQLATPARK